MTNATKVIEPRPSAPGPRAFARISVAVGPVVAVLSIIATILGATWWLGSNVATKADVAAIHAEMREMREWSEAEMREIRGYFVDHLDGHAPPAD